VIRAYLDTNVFLYALGRDSHFKIPCQRVLQAVAGGEVGGETSVLTLQELVHQRRRRGDREATARGREVAAVCRALHPVDVRVSLDALQLVEKHPQLGTGDAFHAATARAHGIDVVISADRDFDGIEGFRRVVPTDDGIAALLSD
jgi:predicted nucleic acid-binding protein